jgi:hypothetical protein
MINQAIIEPDTKQKETDNMIFARLKVKNVLASVKDRMLAIIKDKIYLVILLIPAWQISGL